MTIAESASVAFAAAWPFASFAVATDAMIELPVVDGASPRTAGHRTGPDFPWQ